MKSTALFIGSILLVASVASTAKAQAQAGSAAKSRAATARTGTKMVAPRAAHRAVTNATAPRYHINSRCPGRESNTSHRGQRASRDSASASHLATIEDA